MSDRYYYDSNYIYIKGQSAVLDPPDGATGYANKGPSAIGAVWDPDNSVWVEATTSNNTERLNSLLAEDFKTIYEQNKDNPLADATLKIKLATAEQNVQTFARLNDIDLMKAVITAMRVELPTTLKPLADQLLSRFPE